SGVPEGFHTVTPYIAVPGIDRVIRFLEATFGATVTEKITQESGRIMHAQVRVGDSPVMLGEPMEGQPSAPGMLYVYVADCDATYRKAIAAGGQSLMEPANMFYGDRHGGVSDPAGNKWWIAQRIENVPHDELQRRARQFHG